MLGRSPLPEVPVWAAASSTLSFDDTDWDNALFWATLGITASDGQICAAGSRIYVQDTIYDRFVKDFSKRSQGFIHGDSLLRETTKGAVTGRAQLERILSYIQKGKDSGARLLHGGERLPGDDYFVANTAFTDVEQRAAIMQEEVFGPLASIARFSTEDEVIAKANDTTFGLAAAVFTNDINKALRSGFGRDMGREAVGDWTTTKTAKWNILAGEQ
ncbi:hypothetical protein DL769_009064 [Monosporascus sp. CRB-8-3]|nr:hypothetical protein DL769_009064 [Monosporascus sp. CRB-8-3]